MGSRPAKLSEGGGGKFNNVDGIIKSYEFTTTHPFAKEGRRKGNSDFNPLYGVVTARMDGAEDDDVDVLLVGSADDFEISEDSLTLTPEEGKSVWAKSQWGQFIASLEKLGVETENADYDEGVFNYEPIVNRRVRFQQVQQFDKNGKVKQRKGKGRDGKERLFDDTTTIVVSDYGEAEAPKKGAGKSTSAKTTKPAGGKANGAAKEVDLTDKADEALVGLLEKFGGSATRDKLVSAPGQLYLKKNFEGFADDLRQLVHSENYIKDAVERGIAASYKNGTVTANA